jgi:hypothetical protein
MGAKTIVHGSNRAAGALCAGDKSKNGERAKPDTFEFMQLRADEVIERAGAMPLMARLDVTERLDSPPPPSFNSRHER